MDSPAQALRASADLADLTHRRVRPALQGGAVVVCEGFVDATIVAHRAAGVEEQRFARVAQWAVNGLKADLTVLVDGTSAETTANGRTEPRAGGRSDAGSGRSRPRLDGPTTRRPTLRAWQPDRTPARPRRRPPEPRDGAISR